MDITIKKVGQTGGKDRFILVNAKTRKVVTANDVSERAVRQFFRKRGSGDELIDACLQTARERYTKATSTAAPVDQAAETMDDEDGLLFELGLDDDSDADIH